MNAPVRTLRGSVIGILAGHAKDNIIEVENYFGGRHEVEARGFCQRTELASLTAPLQALLLVLMQCKSASFVNDFFQSNAVVQCVIACPDYVLDGFCSLFSSRLVAELVQEVLDILRPSHEEIDDDNNGSIRAIHIHGIVKRVLGTVHEKMG